MKKILKTIALIFIDFLSITLAWILSFLCVGITVREGLSATWFLLLIDVVAMYLVFVLLGLYNNIWKYAGVKEGLNVMESLLIMTGVHFLLSIFPTPLSSLWAFVVSFIKGFCLLVSTGMRFAKITVFKNCIKGCIGCIGFECIAERTNVAP